MLSIMLIASTAWQLFDMAGEVRVASPESVEAAVVLVEIFGTKEGYERVCDARKGSD